MLNSLNWLNELNKSTARSPPCSLDARARPIARIAFAKEHEQRKISIFAGCSHQYYWLSWWPQQEQRPQGRRQNCKVVRLRSCWHMAGRARSPGSWCSGITSASHAEGPGFKSQWVHSLPASPVCHQQQFGNLPSASPASKKKPITQGRQQPRTQARKPYAQTQCPAHARTQHAMCATQPSPRKTRQLGRLNKLSI